VPRDPSAYASGRLGVTKRGSGRQKSGLGATAQGLTQKHLVITQYIPPCYDKAWGGVMMNLVELVKGSSSEEEADDRCPFCGHQKIDGCRKEWSIRKDSMASRLKSPID